MVLFLRQFTCYFSIFICFLYMLTPAYTVHLIVVETGLGLLRPESVAIQFNILFNNTLENDVEVDLVPLQCHLLSNNEEDSTTLNVYGLHDVIPKFTMKTLTTVAPVHHVHNRKGNYTLRVNTRDAKTKRTSREVVTVHFDTRDRFVGDVDVCVYPDEDPANNCNLLNCEVHYNDKRSFHSDRLKRCIEVPVCVSDGQDLDNPKVIYDPVANLCRDASYLSDEDLDYLKFGGLDQDGSTTGKVLVKKKSSRKWREAKPEHKSCLDFLNDSFFVGNATILGAIVVFQCIVLLAIVYCFRKKCKKFNEKVLNRSYYNYRQEASVTTPLITNSVNDSETTLYKFQRETKRMDEKQAQSYKSIPKEFSRNSVKKSMSDDIISKCLNRRDWCAKVFNTDAIAETSFEKKPTLNNDTQVSVNHFKVAKAEGEKPKEHREHEKRRKSKKKERHMKHAEDGDSSLDFGLYSEEVLNSYDYVNLNVHTCTNAFGHKPRRPESRKGSNSEKGTQAQFPDDSLDDFLTEKGIVLLNNDSFSKFALDSSKASSKTSKCGVKSVLSLLFKKKSRNPASYPGDFKSKDQVKVEFLRKSSLYSSTPDPESLSKDLGLNASKTSL